MKIKAIDTPYKGYLFRSRLEARYAYLFDLAGISWNYEPEAYELADGTNYLPDFFLQVRGDHWRRKEFDNPGYWVEIKGGMPTPKEIEKMHMLAMGTRHHGYIFYGDIGVNNYFRLELEGRVWGPDLLGLEVSSIFCDCTPNRPSIPDIVRFIKMAREARFDRGGVTPP